jgi:GT2 family glycosyltransferase
MTSLPKVYVVLLNWNGWEDTLECLESVFRLSYREFRVIVCDNASTDDSIARIREWADGRLNAAVQNPALARFTNPPISRPLSYTLICEDLRYNGRSDFPLVIIQASKNRGFAAGCNAGIRFAISQGDCDYVWLLNNDTVVTPDALSRLVDRMSDSPKAGLCGSTLVYYHHPEILQSAGGATYNKWTARSKELGKGESLHKKQDVEQIERKLAYVSGASMIVSRAFLDQIGLLNERYFLYFEEIDWATRAKRRFSLLYANKSVVYHKHGASIGTARSTLQQSEITEFYATRNRLIYTLTYNKWALPSVIVAILCSAVHRAVAFRWRNLIALLRGVHAALFTPGIAEPRICDFK